MKNLITFLLLLTALFSYSQTKKNYMIKHEKKRYTFEVFSIDQYDRCSKSKRIKSNIISYTIRSRGDVQTAGNLPFPKKKKGLALEVNNIIMSEDGTIIIKTTVGYIFRYRIQDNGIATNI